MKEGWKYKKIKEVGVVIGGTTPSTTNPAFWNGDICWISPAELKGERYLYDSVKKITKEAVTAKSLKELPIGTVILSTRAPIGKLAINKVPMYCNQGFKCVVCGNELYNEYLYWWLYGKKEYLNSLGTGATFPEISKSVVENIEIPVPPLPEQQRIVEYLEAQFAKIDALKANAAQQLQAAKDLFQSALKDLMTPKEGWEEKKLGEVVVKIFAGGDLPKNNYSKERTDKYNIPIYANAAENDGLYGYTNIPIVETPSITVAARGSGTGLVLKRNTPFFPIVRLIVVIPKKELEIDYLFFALKGLKIKSNGSAIPQLTVPMIKDYKISFPTNSEQKKIADTLDDLSNKIKALQSNYEQTITLCNDLKQALLRETFG